MSALGNGMWHFRRRREIEWVRDGLRYRLYHAGQRRRHILQLVQDVQDVAEDILRQEGDMEELHIPPGRNRRESVDALLWTTMHLARECGMTPDRADDMLRHWIAQWRAEDAADEQRAEEEGATLSEWRNMRRACLVHPWEPGDQDQFVPLQWDRDSMRMDALRRRSSEDMSDAEKMERALLRIAGHS